VIFVISEEYLQDATWFDPIFADLDAGGYEEFLHYLLHMDLADWHPRQQLKTAELAKHQRMSGDSITQWAQACVAADQLVGESTIDLGQRISSEALRQSHAWYCKQQSLRPANEEVFGGACTAMFGRRQRLPAQMAGKPRPWGYDVPTGDAWQEKIDERLGIAAKYWKKG
jgi:hypothetical protein